MRTEATPSRRSSIERKPYTVSAGPREVKENFPLWSYWQRTSTRTLGACWGTRTREDG